MLIAMGIAAGLCVLIGIFPQLLYAMLPYELTYKVWDAGHVLGELQLLLFAVLAFVILMVRGWYPPEIDSTVLNTDWFIRRAIPRAILAIGRPVMALWFAGVQGAQTRIMQALSRANRQAAQRAGIGHINNRRCRRCLSGGLCPAGGRFLTINAAPILGRRSIGQIVNDLEAKHRFGDNVTLDFIGTGINRALRLLK